MKPTTLPELALLFLRLGLIGFGGPAAHISMMEDEFVRRRQWLTREAFLDLLAATHLIPGPNSTEMAIHIGYLRRGWAGLIVAGTCFILPAMFLVWVIAWAYRELGNLPQVMPYLTALLYGVKPVVIAVVIQALIGLGKTALKSPLLIVLGIVALAWNVAGGHELLVLFGIGLAAALAQWARQRPAESLPLFLMACPVAAGTPPAVSSLGLGTLFLTFLKIGSILFGSGYVLLAFLRADFVETGWLTEGELLDAVAVGQVTPGPVFTTATFIGYLLGGHAGAVVATIGIFLPAFVFVALSGPLVPRLRQSALAAAFLDGVIVASLALMAVVTWQLGRAALVDGITIVLGLVSLAALNRWRVNSAWLVLMGAGVGLVLG
jgi:chromate transporter